MHPEAAVLFAEFLAESFKDQDDVISSCLDQLRLMFGQDKVPPPLRTKITWWRDDPFSLGSYSCLPPGIPPFTSIEFSNSLSSYFARSEPEGLRYLS